LEERAPEMKLVMMDNLLKEYAKQSD
jgi:hypothetical protein